DSLGSGGDGAVSAGVGILEGGVVQVIDVARSQFSGGNTGYEEAVVLLLAGFLLGGAVCAVVRGGNGVAIFEMGRRGCGSADAAARAMAGVGGGGGGPFAFEHSGGE